MSRIPVGGPVPIRHDVRAAPVPARRSIFDILPVVLVAYSSLLPQEVRFEFAEQQIFPWRMVCLVLLPWVISRLARGRFPYRPADLWMFVGSGWMIISFVAVYGFGEGFVRGAALAFDVIVPYVIARVSIRDISDLRRLLVAFAPGIALVGAIMAVESISHQQIVKPFAASIFGRLSRYENGVAVGLGRGFYEIRLGLLRASGPFNHPILAGVFLAALLPLYWTSGLRRWPFYAGVAASLLSFFSVSSAAIFALALGVALLAYDIAGKYATFLTWRLMFALATAVLLFGQVVSEKGLSALLIRVSLNPATGYFRRLIWHFGWISVEKHPWFGIGFKDYERHAWMVASVDNYWLLLAMRHGLITAFAFLAATIAAIYSVARMTRYVNRSDRKFLVGMGIAVFILAVAGFSVALFGPMASWYFMLLGAALSLRANAPVQAPVILRSGPPAIRVFAA